MDMTCDRENEQAVNSCQGYGQGLDQNSFLSINLMFLYECVPNDFGKSVTFAIPKGSTQKINTTAVQ